MDKKNINNNGFDYVDLGLPSETLWATCNVGATKPSESGQYFQWGITKGYYEDQIVEDKPFDWNRYKWSINGSNTNFSKYINPGETLELEDDAAHINMGGDWHMPTHNQFFELMDNTISDWVIQDNIKGITLTSKKDTSKFIFIPAAGFACKGSVYNTEVGHVWSSMLMSPMITLNIDRCISDGMSFGFNSVHSYFNYDSRRLAFSVRGVIG